MVSHILARLWLNAYKARHAVVCGTDISQNSAEARLSLVYVVGALVKFSCRFLAKSATVWQI